MARGRHYSLIASALTAALVLLVGFAATEIVSGFVAVMLTTVVGAFAAFHWLFPQSRFVAIAFVNLIAVYACLFVFFVAANFTQVDQIVLLTGFTLPILAFLAGAVWRHREIGAIVASEDLREERNPARVLRWLVPVFAIGALTFLVPGRPWGPIGYDAAFLIAMGGISAIATILSRDVSAFLLDAGLLFEEFFQRITRLLVPAFAFLTFYSLLVIVFGAIYRIVDHLAPEYLFRVNGTAQKISFPEALYFSIVTLSTVGYGDIVPAANLTRIVVAVQIVCGIVLLLFGFSEIIAYTRDRHRGSHSGE